MIAYLLARKIFQLFLIMLGAFVLVKSKTVRSQDSILLSKVCLYLIVPCAILNSFQIDFTPEVKSGFLFAIGLSFGIHVALVLIAFLCKRILHMEVVECASVAYTNALNIIIPIVTAVVGPEWLIYSTAFVVIQVIFTWTHGVYLFGGREAISWKKILGNVNILCTAAGILMLVSGLRFPPVITETLSSVGSMAGPFGMMITGMVAANLDVKKVLRSSRLYLTAFMRMIFCPLVYLIVVKLLPLAGLVPNGWEIVLVIFLSTMTPAAATMTSFAQLFHKDAEYASAINIVTTLSCILTMPLFVLAYEML